MMQDAAYALEAADEKITDCVAAIDALDDSNDAYIKENERLKKRIEELEAQIPKRGELIEDDATYCGADRANYKCSRCGKICGTWKRGLTQNELPNYCPNCGARMRKGEEK
jgi:DNA-directed RNA polymerase subunit RPC12/RpoP